MGARVDDTAKLSKANIKANPDASLDKLSLITKLCWSKNIQEENQGMYYIVIDSNYYLLLSSSNSFFLSFFVSVHEQILFGAGDVDYCVLLGLASFMEYSIEQGWNEFSDHLFCMDGLNDPITIKNRVSKIMCDALDDPTFSEVLTDDDKKVGTHSTRKYACTYATRCGCSKDDIDYRFRWKNRRMQDRYVEGHIPVGDAKVAAALCKGEPITYEVKSESMVTDSWILAHVVPNIAKHYNRVCCILLGKALLWRIMDPVQSALLPSQQVNRVRRLYLAIEDNILTEEENPIAKIPLSVHGYDGDLQVSTLVVEEEDDDDNGTPLTEEQLQAKRKRKYDSDISERRVRARRSDNKQLEALTSHIVQLRSENKGKSSRLYFCCCCLLFCLLSIIYSIALIVA